MNFIVPKQPSHEEHPTHTEEEELWAKNNGAIRKKRHFHQAFATSSLTQDTFRRRTKTARSFADERLHDVTKSVTYVMEITEYEINQSDHRVGISNTVVHHASVKLQLHEQIIHSKKLVLVWSRVWEALLYTSLRLSFSFYQSYLEFLYSHW